MPISAAVLVGPADIRSRRGQGLLTCLGLRSGACLSLYDPAAKVGGMAHITSSESSERNPSRPGKFASSAIEALIQNMERSGASRSRLTASIVGGAEISVRAEDEPDTLILDAGVCRAVELELRRHEIPLSFQEIGGKCDRSVVFDVSRGSVIVKAVDQATWYSMISQPLEKVAA